MASVQIDASKLVSDAIGWVAVGFALSAGHALFNFAMRFWPHG